MLINTAIEISGNSCCKACVNKVRILGIEDNLRFPEQADILFEKLQISIDSKDIKGTIFVVRRLFLEEVQMDLINLLIAVYEKSDNKDNLIEELKKSYIKRGVKGVLFAWYPILDKYKK